jgi:NAD-specific glutamate dehydrogenase
LGVRELRAEVEALYGTIPTEGIYRAHIEIERALAEAVPTILALETDHATLGWRERLAPVGEVLDLLARPKVRLMTRQGVQQIEETAQRMSDLGVPKKVAKGVAGLRPLTHAFPIHALNQQLDLELAAVAHVYFAVGYGLGTIPLASALARQIYRDNWDHQAVLGIRRSLFDSTLDLARLLGEHVLASDLKTNPEEALAGLGTLDEMGRQLRAVLSERVPVSAATVLSERLRQRIRMARALNGPGA